MRTGALALVTLLALAAPAAAVEDFVGIRPLGMGNAGRAYATGDAGPQLNPSGMSLLREYHLEGAYAFSTRRDDHYLHASVVDSTSEYKVAGGLYYTFHTNKPEGLPGGTGHEGGFALSAPFGNYLMIGATIKYLHLSGDQAPDGHTGGLTFDVGATVRPMPLFSLAVVGTNLRNLSNSLATQGLAYGGALIPLPNLVVAVDGVTPFVVDTYSGRKASSLRAGADMLLAERYGARLGGGFDGASGNGYLSAGLSLVDPIGAIDVGFRQDITRSAGSVRETMVGAALRLFLPANQPSEQPPL
jgi:hypothetical protein